MLLAEAADADVLNEARRRPSQLKQKVTLAHREGQRDVDLDVVSAINYSLLT